MVHHPFISVVTPTYNQAEYISKTFDSLLDQKLPKYVLEYIVVDALSDDGTEKIVRSYIPKFRKAGIVCTYIREKDRGQSDAINKGWKQAHGKIVSYINSDDYYEKGALEKVIQYFEKNKDCMWAYGGWNLVNRVGKIYSSINHTCFSKARLLNYCNIGQPSCFFRKSLLTKFGYLNTDLHLSFDYDLWLRFASEFDAGMISGILSSMRYYSEAKSARQTIKQTQEVYLLARKYSAPFSFRRIMQFFYYVRGITASMGKADVIFRISKT